MITSVGGRGLGPQKRDDQFPPRVTYYVMLVFWIGCRNGRVGLGVFSYTPHPPPPAPTLHVACFLCPINQVGYVRACSTLVRSNKFSPPLLNDADFLAHCCSGRVGLGGFSYSDLIPPPPPFPPLAPLPAPSTHVV